MKVLAGLRDNWARKSMVVVTEEVEAVKVVVWGSIVVMVLHAGRCGV